jgi:hypothetical protein
MRNAHWVLLLGLLAAGRGFAAGPPAAGSSSVCGPVAVTPWISNQLEEQLAQKNDWRTTIIGPIVPGAPPPLCEDAPDEARILRAMPELPRGVPCFYEVSHDKFQIVQELLVDEIDPPRFFPLIGLAQLHHCHWKCTIYYDEAIESKYPFPFAIKRPRVQVVYMDLDHLHAVPGPAQAVQSLIRDLTGEK